MQRIVIETTNKGKLKEFQQIFQILLSSKTNNSPKDIKFLSIDQVIQQPFEVEETGQTYLENARLKAIAAAQLTGELCLADDSGLEVEALDGRPGVYSGRYLRKGGGITGLLQEMQWKENRRCKFVCSLVLADPAGKVIFETEQYWLGTVAYEPHGEQGFGFDPVVYPVEEYTAACLDKGLKPRAKTVAELGPEIKNQLSHRAKAIKKFTSYLLQKRI